MSNWTLFSNHGHVLVCLSRDPEARLRDVAADVGITERAVQKIVRDLQDADMLSVTKSGRRNSYRIHNKTRMRHTLEADCTLKELLKVINKAKGGATGQAGTKQRDSNREHKTVVDISPDSVPGAIKQAPNDTIKEEDEPETTSGPGSKETLKDSADTSKDRKDTSKGSKDTAKVATKIDKQQGTLF